MLAARKLLLLCPLVAFSSGLFAGAPPPPQRSAVTFHLGPGTYHRPDTGPISRVFFNPSGSRLVAVDEERITFWNTKTDRLESEVAVPGLQRPLAFSPDGTLLACFATMPPPPLAPQQQELAPVVEECQTYGICLIEVETLKKRWIRTPYLQTMAALCFSPDGKRLFGTGWFFLLMEWDVATGRRLERRRAGEVVGSALFAPDASLLIWWPKPWYRKRTPLHIYSMKKKKELMRFKGHRKNDISAAALSPSKLFLATAGEDHVIKLWNLKRKRLERDFALPPGSRFTQADTLAFAPDESRLIGGFASGPYAIWDLGTGTLEQILRSRGSNRSVATLAGVSTAAGVFNGTTIRFFQWATGVAAPRGAGHLGAITVCGFLPGRRAIYTCGAKGHVNLWSVDGSSRIAAYSALPGPIRAATVTPDRTSLAVGGDLPGGLHLLDLDTGKAKLVAELPRWPIAGLVYSPDGSLLAVDGGYRRGVALARSLLLLDGKDFRQTSDLGGQRLANPRFLDDTRSLAASRGTTVVLLDSHLGNLRKSITTQVRPPDAKEGPFLDFLGLAYGNRRYVVTSTNRSDVFIVDPATGTCTRQFRPHEARLTALATTPSGSLLATAGYDEVGAAATATVALYDVETGERRGRLEGLSSEVTSLSFGAGGASLFAGCADTTLLGLDVDLLTAHE